MLCPKCGNEMEYGNIGISAGSKGVPRIFWAPTQVFNRMFPNFLTSHKAEKEGGMDIPLGNGLVHPRNSGHICKECRCVLIEF